MARFRAVLRSSAARALNPLQFARATGDDFTSAGHSEQAVSFYWATYVGPLTSTGGGWAVLCHDDDWGVARGIDFSLLMKSQLKRSQAC